MTNLMSFPVPSAVGSLDAYIQTVNRFPLLSEEEEFALATRFRTENDLDAARDLVLSHLRVVVSVARGYAGYGLPQADLIQEGNIGLMKAVKRYDPERKVRLVSFALHWIRAEIQEFVVRNWRLVKIATTKAQRKLFFNLRSMKQGLEPLKPQQISEIAQQLNVSERDVTEMESRFAGHEIALEPGRLTYWKHQSVSACKHPAWRMPCPAWMNAAAASSRRAGCTKARRPPCTNWQPSSRFPPSASARSNRKH